MKKLFIIATVLAALTPAKSVSRIYTTSRGEVTGLLAEPSDKTVEFMMQAHDEHSWNERRMRLIDILSADMNQEGVRNEIALLDSSGLIKRI